jgi:peptide/nickel transport system permease protein
MQIDVPPVFLQKPALPGLKKLTDAEKMYAASQWQLMWRRFRSHKLALIAGVVLAIMYLMAILAPFLIPYDPWEKSEFVYAAPSSIHFIHEGKFVGPFVYNTTMVMDNKTWSRTFAEDTSVFYPLRFFVNGFEYDLLGFIPGTLHLFDAGEGHIFLMGTDLMGRDLFSRVIWAFQISLSIGLVGVFVSFILGCILGGLSGFYGGVIDMVTQRMIEFINSIPTIPLWMALSAAVPPTWDQIQVYMGITIILSLRGWCGLARQVRSKLLQMREEDFVIAAKVAGTSDWGIITRHLLPGFMSILIVDLTLSIPGMIMGETALSFLMLGLRPPTVSWGTLMQNAQNVSTLVSHPWELYPALFVIIAVLAFNFLGDGLRDAADPYSI